MEQEHGRAQILEKVKTMEYGVVATLDQGKPKVRAMHFAVDDDFNFYLSSLKGDPKVRQLTENRELSLLLLKDEQGFFAAEEIEVSGVGEILQDDAQRRRAFELLAQRSPIVLNMSEGGALGMLEAIKISPLSVKYRLVPEIMRGIGPTVLEFAPVVRNLSLWDKVKERTLVWLEELRAPFLTGSVLPVLAGALVAWSSNNVFRWDLFVLTLLGIVFIHLGTNIANDYFDHLSGNDAANTEFVRPFSGGSRLIQKGLLQPGQVLFAALFFFVLATVIGLYLTVLLGPVILLLGIIGVFSGFFYSAPPFKLASRGLGELFVGINFGVLVTLGAYYVQTGQFALEPVLVSLPLALLITAILYINEFPDYRADKAVGKRTLVVRLGREKAVLGYSLLMSLVFISIIVSVLFGLVSPFTLLILLVLPRALRAIKVAKLNFDQPLQLIPANADTIMCHLQCGLLLAAAYIIQKLV